MKKNCSIKIIAVCSVITVAAPFVSFAIPFSTISRDFNNWPFFYNENNENRDGADVEVWLDGSTRVPRVPEEYTQIHDSFGDSFRNKVININKRKKEAEAARKKALEETETHRGRSAKTDNNIQKEDRMIVKPPIQLGFIDVGNPKARRSLFGFLNRFTDPQSGKLIQRPWWATNRQDNVLTEAMKRHALIPPGFLTFKTSNDGSFSLEMGNTRHPLFHSTQASFGSRFNQDILKKFQSDYIAPGQKTGPPPSVRGPGDTAPPLQPIVTGGLTGARSNQSDIAWTAMIPLEFFIPQFSNLTWGDTSYSLLYGNKTSSSNPYFDIGFIMTFAKENEDPKYKYTIIYEDPETTSNSIGFYIAEVKRFEKGLMQGPNILVSPEVFLETLRENKIVELFSAQKQRYRRFGNEYEKIVEIPYVSGSGEKISRVEWLIN